MQRTGKITIGEKEYWITKSTRAQAQIEELKDTSPTMRGVKVIKILLDAGYAWAKKQGMDPLAPPDLDTLLDDYDDLDVKQWADTVSAVMLGERHVEAKPSKK